MNSRGFTLIELLVTLAITSLTVGVAHAMIRTVADASSRAALHAGDLTVRANARDWLVRAMASASAGGPNGAAFFGASRVAPGGHEQDVVRFAGRVRVGALLTERTVRLHVQDGRLVADVGIHAGRNDVRPVELVLFDHVTEFGADYLSVWDPSAPWLPDWVSTVSAPLGVRLRITHRLGADTLVIAIGGRG